MCWFFPPAFPKKQATPIGAELSCRTDPSRIPVPRYAAIGWTTGQHRKCQDGCPAMFLCGSILLTEEGRNGKPCRIVSRNALPGSPNARDKEIPFVQPFGCPAWTGLRPYGSPSRKTLLFCHLDNPRFLSHNLWSCCARYHSGGSPHILSQPPNGRPGGL